MNKPIFENEKEAHDFCEDVWIQGHESLLQKVKDKGYIKKSIVEEAEEIIQKYNGYSCDPSYNEVVILIKAIKHLKRQLEDANK
jgi:ABC-type Fe3+ transport system substrate-binding protein